MKRIISVLLIFVFLFGRVGMSWSADCENGVATYNRDNPLAAMIKWQPLAEQGNADAQYIMGIMYDYGGLRNYKTAVKWYTLAAEQGNADAQNSLGAMYEEGKGVPQNYKNAVNWYRLAAEEGCADARNNLGAMYAFGRGVVKDFAYAHMWGKFAASNGAKDIGKVRDYVEKKITPSQLKNAQDLIRECIRKKYKGC